MTPINTEGNDSFKEVKQANFRGKGQGTYQQWISLMNKSDFEKANKLL